MPVPKLPPVTATLTLWLLAKVFASGCTAMTGVEAVSNGVMAFREPTTVNAKRTLTVIIALLIVLLLGIAFMCKAYGIGATDPEGSGYQSVLSQLTTAVAGRGIFYYVTIASILLVLSLSANTAFADFPRLTRAVAHDDFLPHLFALRGRRLLYSAGVYWLVFLTAGLLILFRGVTDRLIPLYAIGAFLAFTLSQAGMVMHWKRSGGPGWQWKMLVNGVGATATGVTLLVVLVAKFVAGAWVTALLIPLLILLMSMVKHHYDRVAAQTAGDCPLDLAGLAPPFVIVPLDQWSRITEKGMRFALGLSHDVQAVHVDCGEHDEALDNEWQHNVVIAGSGCRIAGARTYHLAVPLSLRHPSAGGPCAEDGAGASGPHDCGAGPGVGGQALVGKPAPQPAGAIAEAAAAGQGQPGNCGAEYPLVSAEVTKRLLSHQTREFAFEQAPEQAQGIIRNSRMSISLLLCAG